eukprot:g57509.t1
MLKVSPFRKIRWLVSDFNLMISGIDARARSKLRNFKLSGLHPNEAVFIFENYSIAAFCINSAQTPNRRVMIRPTQALCSHKILCKIREKNLVRARKKRRLTGPCMALPREMLQHSISTNNMRCMGKTVLKTFEHSFLLASTLREAKVGKQRLASLTVQAYQQSLSLFSMKNVPILRLSELTLQQCEIKMEEACEIITNVRFKTHYIGDTRRFSLPLYPPCSAVSFARASTWSSQQAGLLALKQYVARAYGLGLELDSFHLVCGDRELTEESYVEVCSKGVVVDLHVVHLDMATAAHREEGQPHQELPERGERENSLSLSPASSSSSSSSHSPPTSLHDINIQGSAPRVGAAAPAGSTDSKHTAARAGGDGVDEQNLWEKMQFVKNIAAQLGNEVYTQVIKSALTLYYVLVDPHTPFWAKAVCVSALAYFIMPADAVPDLLPCGFGDDVLVMGGALAAVRWCISDEIKEKVKRKMREKGFEAADWELEQDHVASDFSQPGLASDTSTHKAVTAIPCILRCNDAVLPQIQTAQAIYFCAPCVSWRNRPTVLSGVNN